MLKEAGTLEFPIPPTSFVLEKAVTLLGRALDLYLNSTMACDCDRDCDSTPVDSEVRATVGQHAVDFLERSSDCHPHLRTTVILLTIIVFLLLGCCAFLYVRYVGKLEKLEMDQIVVLVESLFWLHQQPRTASNISEYAESVDLQGSLLQQSHLFYLQPNSFDLKYSAKDLMFVALPASRYTSDFVFVFLDDKKSLHNSMTP